ncbi:hypothetical protein HDU81_010426 [Chytriomyces hyalinus]|nr:hypothetical protein HDU81_010426 [Chytriomyces hyalinus]
MFPSNTHTLGKNKTHGHGTLDGVTFTHDLSPHFHTTDAAGPLFRRKPCKHTRIGPRWRAEDATRPPPLYAFGHHEQRVMNEVNFFEAVHQNEGIDRSILTEFIDEAHSFERDNYRYDHTRGNMLHLYKDGVLGKEWLMAPGGLLANELYLYPLNQSNLKSTDRIVFKKEPHFHFKTPILQITSSPVNMSSDTTRLLGVRSFNSVHILSAIWTDAMDSQALSFHEIALSSPSSEPTNIAFNPVLPGEAAWICEDRSIHVWDILSSPNDPRRRTRIIRVGDWMYESSKENDLKWKGIEYAWHPRILLVAEAKSLSVLDLRSPNESTLPFFSLKNPKSTIRAIASNRSNTYEIGMTSTESTTLIDARYPKYPLLEWTLNDPSDPPVGIQFFNSNDESALITWNSRHGEIILHPISGTSEEISSSHPHQFLNHLAEDQQVGISKMPPQSRYAPQRLTPFHLTDPQYSDPIFKASSQQWKPKTKPITMYNPEENTWGVRHIHQAHVSTHTDELAPSEVAPVLFKTPLGCETAVPVEQSGAPPPAVITKFIQKDLTRRKADEEFPPWPRLGGCVIHGGEEGDVHLFQISMDGSLYCDTYILATAEKGDEGDDSEVEFEAVGMDGIERESRESETESLVDHSAPASEVEPSDDKDENEWEDDKGGSNEHDVSDAELKSAKKWMKRVETYALRDHDSTPHLRRLTQKRDFTAYFKYISKTLQASPSSTDAITSANSEKCERMGLRLVEQHEPKTLFEMHADDRRSISITYTEDGLPVLSHPRQITDLSHPDSEKLILAAANTAVVQLEIDEKNESNEEPHEPVNAALAFIRQLDMSQKRKEQQTSVIQCESIPIRVIKLGLPVSGRWSDEDDGGDDVFGFDSIKLFLDREFAQEGSYPDLPENDCNAVLDDEKPVMDELCRLKAQTHAATLSWIASDVVDALLVFGGKHETIETPGSQTSNNTALPQPIDGSEDVANGSDSTIQALFEDEDLNLPEHVEIRNPIVFSKGSLKLSKEAILMRDKWNHPEHWYSDDYHAQLRMKSQEKVETTSNRDNALKRDADIELEEAEAAAKVKKHKKSSGKILFSQQDYVRQSQASQLMSSQVSRVVARSSVGVSQQSQSRIQSLNSQSQTRLYSSSPVKESSHPAASSQAGARLSRGVSFTASQSLSSSSQQFSKSGIVANSLGSQLGSQSQKKKPRRSGF